LIRKGHVVITLLCFILGVLLATQFRSVQNYSGLVSFQRAQELTNELKRLQNEKENTDRELIELRNKIETYEQAASERDSITKVIKSDLEKTKLLAGLTDVEGPGIIVTLDDSKTPTQVGEDPSIFLIHDDDILKVVNELFAGGAEAISINEQRVITTTEIRCVGPAISINTVKQTPPYIIKAIGAPDSLEVSLRMRGGVVETLEVWGININIKQSDNIVVPGFKGPIKFNYAKPVETGGENK
jgi:uncharacterized protein YlxW (UPF0749 family)